MSMKNPPHPGNSIRVACLEPLGISVTKGARLLGVTRQTLSNLINGKTSISPEMAIRLSKAFGSTAETWIRMQTAYDLAQALKHDDLDDMYLAGRVLDRIRSGEEKTIPLKDVMKRHGSSDRWK
jgi:antitoxin HigA-1